MYWTPSCTTSIRNQCSLSRGQPGLLAKRVTPALVNKRQNGPVFRVAASGGPDSFLTPEEAGLVDLAPIDMHEKFLARLTVSSLNLLRVIAEEEGVSVEELNAGKVVDWFTKDAERRQTDPSAGVLKW